LALLSAITLIAQGTKKPIPSNTSVDKASDVIDAVTPSKDTVQPVKRVETESSTTTTSTTSTTTTKPATTSTTTTTPATTASPTTSTVPAATSTPTNSTTTTVSTPVQTGSKSAVYVSSKTTFELLSKDDLSLVDYVEYKLNDGEYMKYTSPVVIAKEGPATITYRAIDKVGNKENAQVLNVIVDNTPPTVNLKAVESLYSDKSNQYASTKNTYVINAEDNAAGVKEISYSIDNEPKQKYTGQAIKLEKSGFHVITYSAVDNSGNVSVDQTYLVNVDSGKPTVEITESIPYVKVNEKTFARKDTTFKVTAKDGESGISKILIKIDAATEFVPYVEDIAFNTSGEHTIEAKSVDNVGNESDPKKITFLYDIKPPETSIKATPN
jgi:hypothetical protein